MTRFKELQRINAAIEQKNAAELEWALAYCQVRQQIATRKDAMDYWRKIESRVNAVLAKNK